MNCSICGSERQAGEEHCEICNAKENKVKVLTSEENQYFDGITVEQDFDQRAKSHESYQKEYRDARIYTTEFKIIPTSFLTKLVIGIILAMMAAVLFFVALPIVMVVIGIAFFSLYFMRK